MEVLLPIPNQAIRAVRFSDETYSVMLSHGGTVMEVVDERGRDGYNAWISGYKFSLVIV